MKLAVAFVVLLGWALPAQGPPPPISSHHRAQAKRMLSSLKAAIREGYYDPAFRGIDLDAHFKQAAAKLDAAQTLPHAYGIIAQALIDFNDSHTYFIPPTRSALVEYGWEMQMVGDACYVTAVKPGTDAAAKGLKPGDEVLQLDQFTPRRLDLWKLRYLLHTLSPRSRVRMMVRSPDDAAPRPLEIAAKVTPQPKVIEVNIDDLENLFWRASREARTARNQFGGAGDVAVWKLSGFDFDPQDVDRLLDTAIQRASALVLDMRGNGGGFMKTLEQLAGRLFDRDVIVANVKTRKSTRPMIAKKRRAPFTGRLVVLIDADSGSAAELLARLVQLEKRGIVIGDRSAGAVMQGQMFVDGIENALGHMIFHASVTHADLVMTDGKSLEKVGVTPDELLLPTGADLAAGRDPVLARAVTALGGSLDSAAAGAMFPIRWK
ncbi:MAG: S41 family peptidase [Vicinamibacterales bacterium]